MVATSKQLSSSWRNSTAIREYWRRPLAREMYLFAKIARGRHIRSRVEFARDCIVIPEGPHEGFNWRPEYQPYCSAVLELMDNSRLRKYRFSGCVQSGKSFVGVICVLWHLLERGEDVGYAVPDLDQSARDKWQKEFLPVILASPELKKYLPDSGEGSQGGTPSSIKFLNGATLRFISGTGKDHHRSNFTVHVVFKTEVDRYDTAGEVSRESSPPEQIDNRTKAYQASGQDYSYEECTVTSEDGRIWMELLESTNHKLHARCIHCSEAVCPTREDFHGIDDADDVEQAKAKGHFRCPSCHKAWTEEQRQEMLGNLIPVGAGQRVTVGTDGAALIEGDLRPTNKLGFTWNAFHNRFWTTENIAEEEWLAIYGRNADDKDLERRQHAWTIPSEPDVFILTPLTIADVMDRGAPEARLVEPGSEKTDADMLTETLAALRLGFAPPNCIGITSQTDVGKHFLHFLVRAFYKVGDSVNTRIIDIGTMPVRSKEVGIRKAGPEALWQIHDRFKQGYFDADGVAHPVMVGGVDGGWQGDEVGKEKEYIVWEFLMQLAEAGEGAGWLLTLGRGQSEPPGKGGYSHPKKLGSVNDKNAVVAIGEQWHVRKNGEFFPHFNEIGEPNLASYCTVNSDVYKNYIREGYDVPVGQDGAVLSFNAFTKEEKLLLRDYGKQTAAEKRERRPVPGRGPVVVFSNNSNKRNHFGDADYGAITMAAVAGLPINLRPRRERPTAEEKPEPLRTPGGQNYLVTER